MADGTAGVYVSGLREVNRSLEKAGVDVAELKTVMGGIAAEATRVMQPFIPAGKTGNLRQSARGNKAKGKAVVTIGKARVPYAGAIQWGWGKQHSNYKHGRYARKGTRGGYKGAHFIEKTDDVMETRVAQMLEDGWADIAERHGLA